MLKVEEGYSHSQNEFGTYSPARVFSRTVDCRYNCTSSYCVSRGIHTSSDPGLHVNFPHPSALILKCLSVSNNPTYSVLVQRFDPHQKRHRESFGETPYLPDFHSNGTQRFGNGPLRQVKLSARTTRRVSGQTQSFRCSS